MQVMPICNLVGKRRLRLEPLCINRVYQPDTLRQGGKTYSMQAGLYVLIECISQIHSAKAEKRMVCRLVLAAF
jgi:hypothetical protein